MWFRKKSAEERLHAELRYHFETLVRESIAAGMEPEEARRQARLEFGGIDQIKEDCRDVQRLKCRARLAHARRAEAARHTFRSRPGTGKTL